MRPIDVEEARHRLDAYTQAVELHPKGTWRLGRCPFHDDRNPSFGVKDGRWTCFAGCGSGDVIDFIMRLRGLSFQDAVQELLGAPQSAGSANGHATQAKPVPAIPARSARASGDVVRSILAGCGPVTERTPAWLYLHSRGLVLPGGLLAHPALYCAETRVRLPALVALLTDSIGEVSAVQQIWCLPRIETENGHGPKDSRAPLSLRKKTRGEMRDSSVRLYPVGPVLGIAEGVETAIAAAMLYRLPVWAACGAGRLAHLWVPACVEQLIVFGDNGVPGQRAADAAEAAHRARGRAASAIFPDDLFGDFNEQLLGER